jgi:5-methylcytosine-specific restriction endonuclease McrA
VDVAVFVLDSQGKALMPCTEKRARLLLDRGRARVHRLVPMVIRLIERHVDDCELQSLRLKIDPGSKTTGLALVRDVESADVLTGQTKSGVVILSLMELVHRGRQISEALTARRQMRHRRRGNLRHRAPRFLNRGGDRAGLLAPSLQHRVDTTVSWVKRIQQWAPVRAISSELVRFDMQKLQNPEINGIEYQQGTLFGYELREYLLEKWARKCAYCDSRDLPLQIEHIRAKATGGSNRASNLTLACGCCNQKKAARSIEDFLSKDHPRLLRILAQAQKPLRDAAAVNATRWKLAEALKTRGLPVELASGGQTKFNRSVMGIPKTHALDAACVGRIDFIENWVRPTLVLKAMGRGSYQRTRLDKFGFPRGHLMSTKRVQGFGTGDMVVAQVPKGVKAGVHKGRVAVRATGNFNIQTQTNGVSLVIQGISHRHCRVVQRSDGYGYFFNRANYTERDQVMPKAADASHPALYLPGMNAGVSRAFR